MIEAHKKNEADCTIAVLEVEMSEASRFGILNCNEDGSIYELSLIHIYTFHLGETWTGVVMAMDNVLALMLLPLFGMLSDKLRTPLGRRTPFILVGTVLAVVCMILLPVTDNAGSLTGFFIALGAVLLSMGFYRSPAVALMPDLTPKPLRSKANAVINLMRCV